jgi:phage FluMu gp28-like protein
MQSEVEEMEIVIERPQLADYQKKILESPARYTVTEAATKIGKTFTHLWWLFEKAHTPPKEGANYWWIAPVYTQAKIAFSRLRRVVAKAGIYRINESELYIETPNGSRIWFKSAEKPDNLYGEDVYAAVFDEFTRAREAAWIALRTTLTATKAPCKFIGNVKGKGNWGYRLGVKARAGEPGYEYFKITAYDAVAAGILSLEEIEQAKRDLPEHAFRELYLAEALDDMANPFGVQFIKKCIKPLSDKPAVCYGVDLAKSHDWTVVIGLDDNGDVCFFERWQSDWGQTRRRIIQIVGSSPAYIDSTGVGDPIVEDIQKECGAVEGYHFTSPSKQKIMEGLVVAVQNSRVSVLEGIMRDEMESFEYEYSKNGVKYRAPEGMHDDVVCALALAFQKYSESPSVPFFTFHRHGEK